MFVIRTLCDDSCEMKIIFAYELRHDRLVIDEPRCDSGFKNFLRDEMRAKFTREEDGELTAPVHYHDVFEEMFQTLPYVLNDEEVLRALYDEEAGSGYHNSSPPQHAAS